MNKQSNICNICGVHINLCTCNDYKPKKKRNPKPVNNLIKVNSILQHNRIIRETELLNLINKPLSTKEIFELSKDKGMELSYKTIQRYLHSLEQHGLVSIQILLNQGFCGLSSRVVRL